jgi:hypothetical protein
MQPTGGFTTGGETGRHSMPCVTPTTSSCGKHSI